MVLKFLLAGVISAVLAGGAMYLAMDEDMLADLRAEAQRVRVIKDVPDLRGADGSSEGHRESVVDRLLGRDDSEPLAEPDNRPPETPDDSTATKMGPDETPSRVGRRVDETPPKRGWLDDFLPERETITTPLPVARDPAAPPRPDSATFDALREQAALVTIPEARDGGYFNILDFALAEGRYDVAEALVADFSSPELRDTARQRIGISHAAAGRMDKAFAVLDDVEVEPLKDAIRLEIIRSVTSGGQ